MICAQTFRKKVLRFNFLILFIYLFIFRKKPDGCIPGYYFAHGYCYCFLELHLFFFFFFNLFFERREGRQKKKRNISVWLPLACPQQGTGPKPRHAPWLGIEPMTLCLTGQHSIHRATRARAEREILR